MLDHEVLCDIAGRLKSLDERVAEAFTRLNLGAYDQTGGAMPPNRITEITLDPSEAK